MPLGKRLLVLGEPWVRSSTDWLISGPLREAPESSSNDKSLGMRVWKSSSSILLSPVTTRLYQECRLLFFKAIAEDGEWEMGLRVVKMSQSLLFLLRSNYLFKINSSWVAASLWLISRALKKVYSNNFCQLFHCLYGWTKFWRSLTCHFCQYPTA